MRGWIPADYELVDEVAHRVPLLDITLLALLTTLVVNMAVCLWRVVAGPTARDRVAGVLLVGTSGAAVALVSSALLAEAALVDVALAFTSVAALVALARVRAEAAQ